MLCLSLQRSAMCMVRGLSFITHIQELSPAQESLRYYQGGGHRSERLVPRRFCPSAAAAPPHRTRVDNPFDHPKREVNRPSVSSSPFNRINNASFQEGSSNSTVKVVFVGGYDATSSPTISGRRPITPVRRAPCFDSSGRGRGADRCA